MFQSSGCHLQIKNKRAYKKFDMNYDQNSQSTNSGDESPSSLFFDDGDMFSGLDESKEPVKQHPFKMN